MSVRQDLPGTARRVRRLEQTEASSGVLLEVPEAETHEMRCGRRRCAQGPQAAAAAGAAVQVPGHVWRRGRLGGRARHPGRHCRLQVRPAPPGCAIAYLLPRLGLGLLHPTFCFTAHPWTPVSRRERVGTGMHIRCSLRACEQRHMPRKERWQFPLQLPCPERGRACRGWGGAGALSARAASWPTTRPTAAPPPSGPPPRRRGAPPRPPPPRLGAARALTSSRIKRSCSGSSLPRAPRLTAGARCTRSCTRTALTSCCPRPARGPSTLGAG